MEATKCLKPSDSGSRIGDRASVQAATRVHAEQASHDEGLVKGSHHGTSKSPVASVSKVQAHLRDAARFRARSTSHAVAAHSSCTKIPLSAGRAQEDENHSRKRRFRPWLATVRLPGSARTDQVLGDDGISCGRGRLGEAGGEPPNSVAAIAARWIDSLQLLEVEIGNSLQLLGQPRSFEIGRQIVEPGAVLVL